MSFTNIINSFLNVRNKVKNSDGDWVDQRELEEERVGFEVLNRNLEPGKEGEITVFNDFGSKIILDHLIYSAESAVYPLLFVKQGSTDMYGPNELFTGLSKTGRGGATPTHINANGHSFLQLETDYDSSGRTIVSLKRPIELPEGASLRFRALSSSSGAVLSYYGSYVKVVE